MTAVLELTAVEKIYGSTRNPLRVLRGIDLSIEPGEYLAITGPSGSGKSTMLNILGCLDRPSAGTYRLDGQDVATLSDRELSNLRNERIGFVFQSFNLIAHLTVLENIEIPLFYAHSPRRDRRARCSKVLEAVGLGHRLAHLPSELSGGENQRAAVARALVNDPRVLLADEPTGNLDSAIAGDILRLFRDLNAEGRTIVMITHDRDVARQAPRLVTFRDGMIQSDVRAEAAACASAKQAVTGDAVGAGAATA
jgi:putative ABC transport system ATP-binding protein